MNNVNGILLVIASMAAFTLEDVFIKQLTSSIMPGQILVMLGLVCSVVFLVMAIATRKRIFVPEAWQLLPMIRAMSEAVAAVAFVTALARVDLSTVAAVFPDFRHFFV
ncbi:EamA family transporter [Ruegeria sp.]|uniref:EamA family transporter n=1 Tax=Ruegeria sp. TaxID=1879320 RepID=UPI003AFF91A1